MGLGDMMKIKGAWDTFVRNHPKFPAFLNAASAMGVKEDTVIGISFTDPNGQKIETNFKVTASDLQLFETLKNMKK